MCERIFDIGELVDEVSGITSETKFGVVVVVVQGTGSPTQAFTVAFLVVNGSGTVSSVRGGSEIVQRDVGRSSRLAAAAGVKRNVGERD
jgi:hypothetical protein